MSDMNYEDIPSLEEMDRRVEEADLPDFEEVVESGLLPDHGKLSDVDHMTDEEWYPTALAIEMDFDGHRRWYKFQYDEDGEVIRV